MYMLNYLLEGIMILGMAFIVSFLFWPFIAQYYTKDSVVAPEKYLFEITSSIDQAQKSLIRQVSRLLSNSKKNIQIEILARQTGINIFLNNSRYKKEILSLINNKVTCTACQLAVLGLTVTQFSDPILIDGVKLVADGAVYGDMLRDQGFIDAV